MKLLPFMRRAVPLLVTIDGVQRCVEVPLQVFLAKSGHTILRLGDNTLSMDPLPQGRSLSA